MHTYMAGKRSLDTLFYECRCCAITPLGSGLATLPYLQDFKVMDPRTFA